MAFPGFGPPRGRSTRSSGFGCRGGRGNVLSISVVVLLVVSACASPADSPGAESPAPEGAAQNDAGTSESINSVADVLAIVEGLDPEARKAELQQLAEQEDGPITLYTSLSLITDILDQVEQSLRESTGLELEVYRADGEALRTRIFQEAEAGRQGVDVIETAGRMLEQLAGEDLIAPYESPHEDELIAEADQENWTATRLNIYAVAWNTDLVADDERPTSYEGLADDRWEGRLTLEPTDYDWYWSVSNYWRAEGYTEERIDELWRNIAGNSDFVSGHTSTVELVSAGEYDVMASAFAPTVERFSKDGVPIAWRPPVEPLFATPNAASIYQDTARPASAVLFMDWLLTDGLGILAENEIFVTRQDLQNLGDLDVNVIDVAQYLPAEPEVMEEYDALAR